MNGIVKAYFAVCTTIFTVQLVRGYGRRKEQKGYNRGFADAVDSKFDNGRQKRDYDEKMIFN